MTSGMVRPTHNPMDKFSKSYTNYFVNDLLNLLDYDVEIDRICPTEIIEKSNEYRTDFVGLSIKLDIMVLLEFESDEVSINDVKRYTTYGKLIRDKYDKPVLIIVISTAEKKRRVINYQLTPDLNWEISIETFKPFNGDKFYDEIRCKNKIEREDIGMLGILPLMETTEPIGQVILKLCNLINELDIDGEFLEYLKTAYKHLIEFYLDDVEDEELIKEIKRVMKIKRFRLFEEEIEEGKLEGKLEIAKFMLSEGETLEKISKYTQLNISQIEKLAK